MLPIGLLVLALFTSACASGGVGTEPPRAASSAHSTIDTEHVVVTAGEALGIEELLARADEALEAGRYEDALRDYRRVIEAESLRVAVDPSAPAGPTGMARRSWLARAWFGAGTAHDLLGDHLAGLRHYRHVHDAFPEASFARTAGVRCVRLLVHLERVEEAARLARGLVDAGELTPLERVASFGALALDAVARGDDVGAQKFVARGRQVVDAHELDGAGRIPRDLAPLFFALGEVRRVRAERLGFDVPTEEFPARLEERCQLLLDAQSAYSDAMRAHDAHWSAMAGVRVGELYQKLHEDVMRVPPPETADTAERRALFEGAMRLRYSILLRKARTMLEHTLAMVERTGQATPWAEKAREARAAILEAIDREEAALDRLPHSRRELEDALDALQDRATAQPGQRPAGPPRKSDLPGGASTPNP